MSDSIGSLPGSLSPRNTDTVSYRILKELPKPEVGAVGALFTAWPQGEVFACVSGLGLGAVKNGEIADWLSAGLIEREVQLTPAQERARLADLRAAGTPAPEAIGRGA